MISKATFCAALSLIKQQSAINEEFSKALEKVGDGHFVFGTDNKYLEALFGGYMKQLPITKFGLMIRKKSGHLIHQKPYMIS